PWRSRQPPVAALRLRQARVGPPAGAPCVRGVLLRGRRSLPTLLLSQPASQQIVLNRSLLGMKIPRAILKFGIFTWQFCGCIGMPRLLRHDPDKREVVFRERSCPNKKLKRDDDSSENHRALAELPFPSGNLPACRPNDTP